MAVEKQVEILTWNFRDPEASKELVRELKAIDPEIIVTGRAALSGGSILSEILEIALKGIAETVVSLVLKAVVNYAKAVFKNKREVKTVRIYGPDTKLLTEVKRDQAD